jgi:hypothetical protein
MLESLTVLTDTLPVNFALPIEVGVPVQDEALKSACAA